jgi:hypothetical protein
VSSAWVVSAVPACGSASYAFSYDSQPSAGPTEIFVQRPPTSANLAVSAAPVTTCETRPRSTRSARSSAVSNVVAGMTTAPSFIAASIVSHSSTWLPSMSRIRWPRWTPRARSHPATRLDRSASSAKLSLVSEPSSSTIHSAGRSGYSSASTPSNQSSAQLNPDTSGQRNPLRAVS